MLLIRGDDQRESASPQCGRQHSCCILVLRPISASAKGLPLSGAAPRHDAKLALDHPQPAHHRQPSRHPTRSSTLSPASANPATATEVILPCAPRLPRGRPSLRPSRPAHRALARDRLSRRKRSWVLRQVPRTLRDRRASPAQREDRFTVRTRIMKTLGATSSAQLLLLAQKRPPR